MSQKKSDKSSVLDQVIEQLEIYINSPELAINDRLPAEMTLSAKFGVARPTIREAYRILEAKGNVKRIPGHGVFLVGKQKPEVDPISSTWFKEHKFELEDIFRIRILLEMMMIESVIEKNGFDELLPKLKENYNIFIHDKYNPSKALHYTKLDEEFHQIICDFTGNSLLIDIFRLVLNPVLYEIRFNSFKSELNWRSACRAHERILSAMQKGNPIAIKETLEDHIRQTRALLYMND